MWRTCEPACRFLSRSVLGTSFDVSRHSGKITLFTILGGAVALSVASFMFFQVNIPVASADDVTTSVTVLNTPPSWTVTAEESTESSTTTPTNAGQTISWIATGTDSNSDDYFLLICKTSGAPTANADNPPTCNGGQSNEWAISATTTSGSGATASTSTIETAPFDGESNDWYAWICDANTAFPQCNATFEQGSGSTASPFVINHPPIFSALSNDSPVNPDGTVTWTTTSSDTDTLGGAATVQLFVCRANDFTGSFCGAGGSWATSTAVASDASTSTVVSAPIPDGTHDAYVFLIDDHGLVATSSLHASNSVITVNNVAPTISAATISLLDIDLVGNLELANPAATSGPYSITFDVSDDNSCQNQAAGDEITSTIANVYRSGVASTSCYTSGHYDANNCYSDASALTNFSCSQNGGTCSGTSDSTVTWTCTFDLWYVADPTDSSTQYTSENWLVTVEATDDDTATTSLIESSSGNELASFLAFDVTETSIPYGGLQPGTDTGNLGTTTDLIAQGNVGLDEDLYGDTMCTTWTVPDSCDIDGIDTTEDIIVGNQEFATSSVSYGSGTDLTSSSSPTTLEINVPKTTSTSSPATRDTYWGIAVPGTITQSGSYTGQNTITAIKSDPSNW